jgi:hypothetical protein
MFSSEISEALTNIYRQEREYDQSNILLLKKRILTKVVRFGVQSYVMCAYFLPACGGVYPYEKTCCCG